MLDCELKGRGLLYGQENIHSGADHQQAADGRGFCSASVMLAFVVVGAARAKMAIHAPCQTVNPAAAIQTGGKSPVVERRTSSAQECLSET
jgi:hypothetical protein